MLASFNTHLFWQALSSGPYWRGALTALELTAASLSTAVERTAMLACARSSEGGLQDSRGSRVLAQIELV